MCISIGRSPWRDLVRLRTRTVDIATGLQEIVWVTSNDCTSPGGFAASPLILKTSPPWLSPKGLRGHGRPQCLLPIASTDLRIGRWRPILHPWRHSGARASSTPATNVAPPHASPISGGGTKHGTLQTFSVPPSLRRFVAHCLRASVPLCLSRKPLIRAGHLRRFLKRLTVNLPHVASRGTAGSASGSIGACRSPGVVGPPGC